MGHAHHFLSRLDRLQSDHLELALRLYRDHDFTREFMARLRLAPAVDRVALSLDDPAEGPFVILSRDGAFVTCLARGMTRLADAFVVPRARLDVELEFAGENAHRRGMIERRLHTATDFDRLMRRLLVAGADLDRDEFSALAAVAPAMRFDLLCDQFKDVALLRDSRPVVAAIERPRPADHEALRQYWNVLWAIAHRSLLIGVDDPTQMFESLDAETRAYFVSQSFSWGAVRQNLFPLAARAAWMVGRVGPVLLDAYAAAYANAVSPFQVANTGLGLIAIGSRHADAAPAVREALARRSESAVQQSLAMQAVLEAVFDAWVAPEKHGELVREGLLLPAKEAYHHRSRRLPVDSPFRFAEARAVPGELALPWLLQQPMDVTGDRDVFSHLAFYCAYTQQLPAEAFFLPPEVARVLREPFVPQQAIMAAHYAQDVRAKKQPARAASAPGRNDPCPCGSGKKFKRCGCGGSQAS